MSLRRCTGCQQDLPDESFYRGKRTKCRDCLAADARLKYQSLDQDAKELAKATAKARRDATRAWVDELKAKPCTDCGGTFPPVCMDWDHLPGALKVNSVGALMQASKKRILEEIAKCELVCANCHRIRTHSRPGWWQLAETQAREAS